MRAILLSWIILLSGLCAAAAAEKLPTRDPALRIEAGTHISLIKRVGLSADETLLATGSDDKTIRLWSLPDGKLQRVLRVPIGPGNDGKIYAVAVSPDGKWVAAGGWDAAYRILGRGQNFIHVFEAATGRLAHRLGPMPDVINDIAFSRDGSRIAAGVGGSNGIFVYRTDDWSRLGRDADYGGQVYGLSWGPKDRLAVSSYDGHLRLYDREAKLVRKVRAPGGNLPFGLAFSPDGKEIAVGYSDTRNVDVVPADTLAAPFAPDVSGVRNGDLSTVEWSKDGRFLYASGLFDVDGVNPIVRWDKGGRGKRVLLNKVTDTVLDMAPYGDSGILFGSADPAFGIWDAAGKLALHRAPESVDMRNKLRGNFLISVDTARVRFGLGNGGAEPWLFDVGALTFKDSKTAPSGLARADIHSLNITGWEDGSTPKIDGKALQLLAFETARSLAIAPDRQSFLIGSDWTLRKHGRSGKVLWKRATPGAAWGLNISADGLVLTAAYGDGTIRWHRMSDGKELLTLFVHAKDKRWVLWTPRGYYAASPDGESLIGWHVNRGWDDAPDFFPAHRFRAQFYRPDVVGLILKTLDEERALELANREGGIETIDDDVRKLAPPVVAITSPKDGTEIKDRRIKIAYSARSPSGVDITDVEFRIDGVLRKRLGSPRAPAGGGREVKGEVELTVPPRNITLSVVARAKTRVSEPASVKLRWAGDAVADSKKPRLFALLVGVSKYAQFLLNLRYAAQDASDMAAAIAAQEGRAFSQVSVRTLTDGKATRPAIERGLEWLMDQELKANDVVLLFMAGHGVTKGKRRFYFLPHEGDPGDLHASSVGKDKILQLVEEVRSRLIIFIDSCYSGKGLTPAGSLRGPADMTGLTNEITGNEYGAIMFSGTTGFQLAQEHEDWQNGAFTEAIIKGLGGAADFNKDRRIETNELALFVHQYVRELTGYEQEPLVDKSGPVREFTIAHTK